MSTAFHSATGQSNLFGKSQDVPYDGVYLFTNQRGIAKRALVMPPEQPVSWVSCYGSLTISQVGKESPNGGINEAGLVVEQTTLWQAAYPAPDDRPAVGELQWIQYMLDTCATVAEVVAALPSHRIAQGESRLHYMVADRTGDCAIIELLDGQTVVHRDQSLPVRVMANSPYQRAVAGTDACVSDYERNSRERFRTARSMLEHTGAGVDHAFAILERAVRTDTVYRLVYDLNALSVHVETTRYGVRSSVSLADLDFAPARPALALNLQQPLGHRLASHFVPYSTAINREAVAGFFRHPALASVFQWRITDEMLEYFAVYPDSFGAVR